MTSTLALAALGAWSYAGFLAEPGPAPEPAPPPPPPAASIEATRTPAVAVVPEAPAPAPAPAGTPAVSPPAPILAQPVYRLADARGQSWDHPDPAYLRSFVEARNRSFFAATGYFTPITAAPRCYGGRCPR